MIVSGFAALVPADEMAVIINVDTTEVATLALFSALRYAKIPVLVIDCEPRNGSFDWFTRLKQRHEFHLMAAPLRKHGQTLDWVFSAIRAERVLLVDSDVEVLNPFLLDRMRVALERNERAFGSGYLHPAQWLHYHYDTDFPLDEGIGYYMPRPWIPFTLLRVRLIQRALGNGRSFMHKLVRNEFEQFPALSRLLWQRFRFASLRNRKLGWLDRFRRTRDRQRPAYFHYDTGAEIHEYLVACGFEFEALSNPEEIPWFVRHLGGATRSGLHGDAYDSTPLASARAYAVERLWSEYGVKFGGIDP